MRDESPKHYIVRVTFYEYFLKNELPGDIKYKSLKVS